MTPLMIGLMLSKDDGDIIAEVMESYHRQLDIIYCIDASSDNSLAIIKSVSKVKYAVHESELGIDGSMLKDGIRQLLLSRIQDDCGYDGWIFPIHSDEIYHGNLTNLIEAAQSEGANVVNTMIAHFVLHPSENGGYDSEDETESITERRKWYFLGQCEICGFKNQQGIYYNFFEHMRVLPHGIHPVKTCSRVIIRKHYNCRNPQQLTDRITDRLARNWQPAYKAIQNNLYITDPKQMITAGAIYSDGVRRFDGTFRLSRESDGWTDKIIV